MSYTIQTQCNYCPMLLQHYIVAKVYIHVQCNIISTMYLWLSLNNKFFSEHDLYHVYIYTCAMHHYNVSHLYHTSLVHGDTVIRVLGELMKSTCCGAMDRGISGLEVGHKRSYSFSFTKGNSIIPPSTTPRVRVYTYTYMSMYTIEC